MDVYVFCFTVYYLLYLLLISSVVFASRTNPELLADVTLLKFMLTRVLSGFSLRETELSLAIDPTKN